MKNRYKVNSMTEFISFQHIQKKYSGVYNTTMLPFTSLFSPHDKHSITYARSPFLFFVHPVKIITAISSPSTGTNEISSTDLILWLIFLWALGKIQTPTGTFHRFCAWALSRGGFSCTRSCHSLSLCRHVCWRSLPFTRNLFWQYLWEECV